MSDNATGPIVPPEVISPETVPPEIVEVALGDRSYDIRISSGRFEAIADAVASLLQPEHIVMLHDANVTRPWADQLAGQFGKHDSIRVDTVEIAAGEPSKSIEVYGELLNRLCELNTDRGSIVVALGGGVVGDLAGFVAATYVRGLRLVQVPTTMLAMVDSSVGGKTGINLAASDRSAGGKNLVGAFWQASMVAIDTQTLSTLPRREYVSGLAEVIKYGVIQSPDFFDWLESNIDAVLDRNDAAVRHVVSQSCRAKAAVVADDERESGRRMILNYGHTFGHAIEATLGYGELLHGEAIAIGMDMAARMAIELKLCPPESLDRQRALIQATGLPIAHAGLDADAMIAAMRNDKKVRHGRLAFILPTRIGHVQAVPDIDPDLVKRVITQTH